MNKSRVEQYTGVLQIVKRQPSRTNTSWPKAIPNWVDWLLSYLVIIKLSSWIRNAESMLNTLWVQDSTVVQFGRIQNIIHNAQFAQRNLRLPLYKLLFCCSHNLYAQPAFSTCFLILRKPCIGGQSGRKIESSAAARQQEQNTQYRIQGEECRVRQKTH